MGFNLEEKNLKTTIAALFALIGGCAKIFGWWEGEIPVGVIDGFTMIAIFAIGFFAKDK